MSSPFAGHDEGGFAGSWPGRQQRKPTEGNRRIKEAHAKAFSDYIREHTDWVAPALVLRAPDLFKFEVLQEISGTQFGVISFPRMASTDLRILDGQRSPFASANA